MAHYSCVVEFPTQNLPKGESKAFIADDALELHVGNRVLPFLYARIVDLRLLNYHLHVKLKDGEVVLSQLGYQTEEFFEKLWQAYAAKSLESLFVEGAPLIACEGDYAYEEPGVEKSSIAKLDLREDSLCIVPHDIGARRVPLCFASEPVRDGFTLSLALDTGESYQLSRLGKTTDPFFDALVKGQNRSVTAWESAHKRLVANLDERLGEAYAQYKSFTNLGTDVVVGLFSSDDEAFWFAAVSADRAAVELVTEEQTATYLYRFAGGKERFILSLRHAMEAVKRHRRLIFVSDEDLAQEPLFVMAQDRSSHVRFLRSCNVGRIIHTSSWEAKLKEFFA